MHLIHNYVCIHPIHCLLNTQFKDCIQFTQVFVIARIESRVTPGRIKPSRGGVTISDSAKKYQ